MAKPKPEAQKISTPPDILSRTLAVIGLLCSILSVAIATSNSLHSRHSQSAEDQIEADNLLDEARVYLGDGEASTHLRSRVSLCLRDEKENIRLARAISKIRQSLQLVPDYPRSLTLLAAALVNKGQSDAALNVLYEANERRPRQPDILASIGSVLLIIGKPVEARKRYEEALALKSDSVEILSSLGFLLYKQGYLDQAEIKINKALALDPFYPDAHINLGSILREQGELADALKHFRRAAELQPSFADIHGQLGFTLAVKGDLIEAVKEYELAIEMAPKCGQYYQGLGLLERRLGHEERATDLLARAEALLDQERRIPAR